MKYILKNNLKLKIEKSRILRLGKKLGILIKECVFQKINISHGLLEEWYF